MTTATLNTSGSVATLTVNGRTKLVRQITELAQLSPGRFRGVANNQPFEIEGGVHAGGAANQWFLDAWGTTIRCESFAEAVRVIENN